MKDQGNMTSPKGTNPTLLASNDSQLNKISDKEFKGLIVSMHKENKNKPLYELQENTDEELNEMRQSSQDMKLKFHNEKYGIKTKLKYWKRIIQ